MKLMLNKRLNHHFDILWHFDIFQTHPRYQKKDISPWAFRGMVSSQSFRMIERTLKPLDLDPLYQHFGYYGIGSLWILWDFLECCFYSPWLIRGYHMVPSPRKKWVHLLLRCYLPDDEQPRGYLSGIDMTSSIPHPKLHGRLQSGACLRCFSFVISHLLQSWFRKVGKRVMKLCQKTSIDMEHRTFSKGDLSWN